MSILKDYFTVDIYRKSKKAFFNILFRRIYSLGGFFFLMSIIDWSVAYHPESKILMDIETALNFFYDSREATKLRVGNMTRALVSAWNKKYEGTSTVRAKECF